MLWVTIKQVRICFNTSSAICATILEFTSLKIEWNIDSLIYYHFNISLDREEGCRIAPNAKEHGRTIFLWYKREFEKQLHSSNLSMYPAPKQFHQAEAERYAEGQSKQYYCNIPFCYNEILLCLVTILFSVAVPVSFPSRWRGYLPVWSL